MKKKHLIIIIAQSVIIALMFIFALIQNLEADRQQKLAEENLNMALKMRQQAEECERLAKEMQLQALKSHDQAQQLYEQTKQAAEEAKKRKK